jgi:hypothetical protein
MTAAIAVEATAEGIADVGWTCEAVFSLAKTLESESGTQEMRQTRLEGSQQSLE